MWLRRILGVVAALLLIVLLWYVFVKKNSIPSEVMADLRKADSFELLSLDPLRSEKYTPERFHSWRILGKTTIASAETRKELLDALDKAAGEHDVGSDIRCFNPRHGIRARRGDRILDLVICFECEKLYVYRTEQEKQKVYLRASAQPALDEMLRQADVPLPEQRGD